jgi:hypothetical protein
MIFLGLSLVCTLAAVLARSPAVMLTMEFGVCAASTVILGAAWWRERGRGDAVDPLIGIAFVAVLLYTSATAGFAGLPVLLGVELPVPSVVDGMFFLSYVLFGVFLWKLGSRSRGHGRHQYLDTLIVTLGLMPVIGVRLIEPQLAAGSVSTAQVAYLAYPVFVSILLGLTVRLAMRSGWSWRLISCSWTRASRGRTSTASPGKRCGCCPPVASARWCCTLEPATCCRCAQAPCTEDAAGCTCWEAH